MFSLNKPKVSHVCISVTRYNTTENNSVNWHAHDTTALQSGGFLKSVTGHQYLNLPCSTTANAKVNLVSAPQYVSQRTISTATQHNTLPVRHSCHVPATFCELWTSSVYLCTAWRNSFSHHAAPATYVEDIPWLSSVSCKHMQYTQQTKPLKTEGWT